MRLYKGESLSNGIGMGRVLSLSRAPFVSEKSFLEPESEKERFEKALFCAEDKITRLMEACREDKETFKILSAQSVLLKDEECINKVKELIGNGRSSEEAIKEVEENCEEILAGSGDEYIENRIADIKDVSGSILEFLTEGAKETEGESFNAGEPFIIVTDNFSPSKFAELCCDDLKGIVVLKGSHLSHTAIMARAHGIPMLLVHDVSLEGLGGLEAVVDCNEGHFLLEPDLDMTAFYRRRIKKDKIPVKREETVDETVRRYANICGLNDAVSASERGVSGIGLFRTEFLYMGRKTPPTEDESVKIYKQIAEMFQDKPVIVRTFDLGGDKRADFLEDKEELKDLRGIKLAIREQDLLFAQLRALLRANIYGNIKVMIPLVNGKTDILNVKAMIRQAKRSLEKDKLLYRDFPLGIMVETVSAVNAIEELAGLSKFLSVGTNDLRAEIAGEDRTGENASDVGEGEADLTMEINERLKASVFSVIAAAKEAGIECGICGEDASDPVLSEQFIEAGVDYLSV